MKYFVLGVTTLLYAIACIAVACGVVQFGRVANRLLNYEETPGTELSFPDDGYDQFGPTSLWGWGETSWIRYEYQVGGKNYFAYGDVTTGAPIRVFYNRDHPEESVTYDVDELIGDGVVCVTFGVLIGWCAYRWRARSIAIHGRQASGWLLGDGAWGLIVLMGVAAALAYQVVPYRTHFCAGRADVISSLILRNLADHPRHTPRDWLRMFRAKLQDNGELSGAPECLAANGNADLKKLCANGFQIVTQADVGSSLCELSAKRLYKVAVSFTPVTRRDAEWIWEVRIADAGSR